MRPVRGKHVQLDERTLVEEHLDTLASGRLAGRAALVLGRRVGMQSLVAALAVLVDLLLGHRRRQSFRRLDALHRRRCASNRCQAFWSACCHTAYRRPVPKRTLQVARLRHAAAEIFSQPAFYWAMAAVFWLRVIVLSALVPRRPDAEGMWEGAHAFLTNPSHMYDAAAAYLAQTHVIAPPGVLAAFVSPPPVAVLALPVAWLPKAAAANVWTAIDAVALVAGLWFLYRTLATRHRLAQPAFWLVAGYFTPLFADISAGQRGGVILLGAMGSIWLEAKRPALAGVSADSSPPSSTTRRRW